MLIMETDADYAKVVEIAATAGYTRTPGLLLDSPIEAIVNAGRWMALCDQCMSGRLVRPDRGFWCAGCGNEAHGGVERPLVWPDADTMAAIEQILGVRPKRNRNWQPPETVEFLADENAQRDLPTFGHGSD